MTDDSSSTFERILEAVRSQSMSVREAAAAFGQRADQDGLGYASLDHLRASRTGFPEVIYCPGKSPEQAAGIAAAMLSRGSTVLGTRASTDQFEAIRAVAPDTRYESDARIVIVERSPLPRVGNVCVVSAGTADRAVAAEAAVCLDVMGNNVARVDDVGVAGLHRVLGHIGALRSANVVIAVAGMDGALPGVIAGLTDKPVIAVPTSVGYGASFGGLAALLTMLNACAGGVSVVNIDNGFGAACVASRINRWAVQPDAEGAR